MLGVIDVQIDPPSEANHRLNLTIRPHGSAVRNQVSAFRALRDGIARYLDTEFRLGAYFWRFLDFRGRSCSTPVQVAHLFWPESAQRTRGADEAIFQRGESNGFCFLAFSVDNWP